MKVSNTSEATGQFTEETEGEGAVNNYSGENCAASHPLDFLSQRAESSSSGDFGTLPIIGNKVVAGLLSQSGEIADIYGKDAIESLDKVFTKVDVAKTLGVAVRTLEGWCSEMPKKIRRQRGISGDGVRWLEGKLKAGTVGETVVDIVKSSEVRREDLKATEKYAIVSRRGKVPRNTRLVIVSADKEEGETYLAICKDNRVLRPGIGLWVRKEGDMWGVVCFGKAAEVKRIKMSGGSV